MVDEQVLFKRSAVVVTPTRFMVGSKTYAIRNIVSTRGLLERPGCIGMLLRKKTIYRVVLTTAAGELSVYESREPSFIRDLHTALDQAIAMQ